MAPRSTSLPRSWWASPMTTRRSSWRPPSRVPSRAPTTDPSPLADDAAIELVKAALVAQRPVRIDSERPSVRLMGTRFVVDSWALDQLLSPNVGTEAKPRLLPSPLDLAAVFGSDFAYAIQRAAGETDYLHYDSQMTALATGHRDAARWRHGEAPSTTPGWRPSSRCGCRTGPPFPTSCAPRRGPRRISRRASAPTPS